MRIVPNANFLEWAASVGIELDSEGDRPRFAEEAMFRIPIGDYLLQLDARIRAAFRLLPERCGLFVWKVDPIWHLSHGATRASSSTDLLDAVLAAIGVHDGPGTLEFEVSERLLVQALAYLTNRWAKGSDRGIYIIPESAPELMLYFCASAESVFVLCRTKSAHDSFVSRLAEAGVPAYGPLIASPFAVPPYKDFQVGRSLVQVDAMTGKPVGNGSDESVVLPEYLPPPRPGT